MKKSLFLCALSVGLTAAGCALLPHTAVLSLTGRPAAGPSLSGPVTLHFRVPRSGYSTQAVQDLSIKQAEVRVYQGSDTAIGNPYVDGGASTYAGVQGSSSPYSGRAIIAGDTVTGRPLVSSYSVSVSSASITLPALPVGNYIIELNFYTTKKTLFNANTGLPAGAAPSFLAAQAEAFVEAQLGMALNPSFTVFSTLPQQYNIDTSTYKGGATASMGFTASSLSSTWRAMPMYGLRVANANLWTQVSTSSTAGNKKVLRVVMQPSGGQTIDPSLLANPALSAGSYWTLYDVNGTSTPVGGQTFDWHLGSELGDSFNDNVLYADLYLSDVSGFNNGSFNTEAGATLASRLRTGSLSMLFNPALVCGLPSSPDIRIYDMASGSTGAVTLNF